MNNTFRGEIENTGGGNVTGYGLEGQLIYRLASLEATLTNSLKRIDEKIDNFQSDFNHKYTNTAANIAALNVKVELEKETIRKDMQKLEEGFDTRVKQLEFFKTEIVAKAMAAAAVVGLIWAIFGDAFKQTLGNIV